MPISLPRRWWEWVLVLSPSIVFVLCLAFDKASAPRSVEAMSADSRMNRSAVGFCIVIQLLLVSGLHFTKPHPRRYVCVGCFLLVTAVVAAVNTAVAFLGGVLFIR
jgi:hypothetical protein